MLKMFKKKKKVNVSIGKVGVIESTNPAIASGINDKFNKKITIFEHLQIRDNNISWGRVIEEIPFTEEEYNNLVEIKKIPIVERRLNDNFEFDQEKEFGEIIN